MIISTNRQGIHVAVAFFFWMSAAACGEESASGLNGGAKSGCLVVTDLTTGPVLTSEPIPCPTFKTVPDAPDNQTIMGNSAMAPPAVDATPAPRCPRLAPAGPSVVNSTTATAGCSCTRRPGPGRSSQCPAGVGEFASRTIGPEGGTIQLTGQQGKGVPFQITFPPGALSVATKITLTETSAPPPGELTDYSPIYLIEPRGLRLANLAFVRVPWSSSSEAIARDLAIYARSEDGSCSFERVGDNYTNAGFNTGSVGTLGYLGVGAPRAPKDQNCP